MYVVFIKNRMIFVKNHFFDKTQTRDDEIVSKSQRGGDSILHESSPTFLLRVSQFQCAKIYTNMRIFLFYEVIFLHHNNVMNF